MTESSRLAVLIDADNVSGKVSRDLFEELAGYGSLTVKRAYGDWTDTQLGSWKSQLHKHAISPMQQFANTKGKNATDSALIIDAMDLLYAGNLDGFVIVSSDGDFTRLATRLRESGMTVYGVGARKTPEAFREACDKFTFLEVLRDSRESEPEVAEVAAPAADPTEPEADAAVQAEPAESKRNLQSMLTKALNKTASDDGDWSALGALGSHLNRTDPSFDARSFGFARLSDLVRAQPYVETRTVTTSSGQGQLWVRLKGTSRRSPAPKDDSETPPRTTKKTAKKTTSRSRAAAAPTEPLVETPSESAPAVEPEAAPQVAPEVPSTTTKVAKKTTKRATRKAGPPQDSGGGV